MTQIRLKRVYSKAEENDGFRVLVDRLWPRGIKKESFYYNMWNKDITPSYELRKLYHDDPVKYWPIFSKKYEEELRKSEAAKKFADKIKNYQTVTLLYASKDEDHTPAKILKDYLENTQYSSEDNPFANR